MLRARIQSLSKLKKVKPFIASIHFLSRSPLPPQPTIPYSFSKNPNFTPKPFSFLSSFSTKVSLNRDGNYADEQEEEETGPTSQTPTLPNPFHICPGCGVHMQDSDPKSPGFFLKPSSAKPVNVRLRPGPPEPEFSDSLKRGVITEGQDAAGDVSEDHREEKKKPPVVCARCHSLRHYGRVKDSAVENLLPDFDFDHTVGRRIAAALGGARTVVLAVVDAADFDGSFPRKVARTISDAIEAGSRAWKEGKPGNTPRLVLVVTKIDLLPCSAAAGVSPTRLEHWVRSRAREGGAHGKVSAVHLVSSVRGWGVRNLVEEVATMAGPRGRVWAVGAQNAGKSTLINAMAKCGSLIGDGDEERAQVSHLTEAPVPGTTLGIVRVEGVFPGRTKLFDTPGLLHPHQITTRLTRDEQKLVNISKELKPRTYRIKAGHSVHIAGLMRLDVEELSVDSVYVTVWASVLLPLHMGKTENAHEMVDQHFGRQLQPPIGPERVKKLGNWVRKEFRVSGNSWESSSVDIAAGGLGWYAISLRGEATLGVWTYDGIDIVLRSSLIPSRAKIFEVSGFSVSKIVSKADQASHKSSPSSRNQKQNEVTTITDEKTIHCEEEF